jgi:hypothetical protein
MIILVICLKYGLLFRDLAHKQETWTVLRRAKRKQLFPSSLRKGITLLLALLTCTDHLLSYFAIRLAQDESVHAAAPNSLPDPSSKAPTSVASLVVRTARRSLTPLPNRIWERA